MTFLQEYFGTDNSRRDLVSILTECGFDREDGRSKLSFSYDGIFINLQEVRDPVDRKAREGFVLELDQPLINYPNGHPLRKFFAGLNGVKAYGCMNSPKYKIGEYLPKSE
ncbi:hypothetical protein J4230_05565 [Candidatus Woesearchaeota archaeon]|nr:hypothetical protein [Candidatus Woesearchaeota archaeon]